MSPSSARPSPRTWSNRASSWPRHGRARSGAGLAVKRGAPKPDISTTEAFKRTLLDAKSICYVEQGATGVSLKGLFEHRDRRAVEEQDQAAAAFQSCRARRGEW